METCVRLTYVVLGPLLFVSVASYKVSACARPKDCGKSERAGETGKTGCLTLFASIPRRQHSQYFPII